MRLAQKLLKEFKSDYIERFPITSHTDVLGTLASTVDSSLKRTIEVEYLHMLSIETKGQPTICDIEGNHGVSWMDLIIKYLRDVTLPNNNSEAYKV